MTPTNIQSEQDLFTLCEAVHQVLKQEITDDVNMYITRGHEIAAYMANTGKMLADAKYHQDEQSKNSILKALNSQLGLPVTTLNMLIKSECKDINYLVNWIEQLDKECKYQLEWLRTCISKEKAQMYLQGSVNT